MDSRALIQITYETVIEQKKVIIKDGWNTSDVKVIEIRTYQPRDS